MKQACIAVLLCAAALAQTAFEGKPARTVANDKLELTVTELGASFAVLKLKDQPAAPNPFWEPVRMARKLGNRSEFRGGTGHFVCVDGFGPVSPAERAAGLPTHGEAHLLPFTIQNSTPDALTLEAFLPVVQEKLTRSIRVQPGENVIYVESKLESLLGFDRPVNWAEHATVGSPWLASGETVVDVSGSRSLTRTWDQPRSGQSDRRLQPGKEFAWPLAPGLAGAPVDLRETPREPHYLDHATTLVDPALKYGWTTALNPRQRLIIGYLFRREEFPWVQYWGNYPPTGKMSRGLEFSTQPFDVPRRETIAQNTLFGAPTFRWLPAKSAIETRFILFYAQSPEGMRRVDEVRLESGALIVTDKSARKTLTLKTSLGL